VRKDGSVWDEIVWGAIEERSFVAKSAPLDDGQVRCGDEAAVIVTVKKLA
jgi:hypothetical protein